MLNINTNLSSLVVQSNLKLSANGLNVAIERMTSGFRINHAKDNAANYAINTNLSTKISAYLLQKIMLSWGWIWFRPQTQVCHRFLIYLPD